MTEPSPRRRRLYRAVAIGAGFGLALAVGELAARIAAPAPPLPSWLPAVPNVHKRYTNLSVPGLSPQATHTTNEYGLRGDPPPAPGEAFRVLTLGGSTTRCGYLDDRKTWPALLQAKLTRPDRRVWVGNAGFNGHSSRGNARALEYLLPTLQPQALIVLVGVNDLLLSLHPEYLAGRKHYDDLRFAPEDGFAANSRLISLLRLAKQVHWDRVPTEVEGPKPAPLIPVEKAKLTPVPTDLDRWLGSLPAFRANVESIIDQAERAGVAVLFLTQPLRYGDGPPWDGLLAKAVYVEGSPRVLSAETFWRMLQRFNAELKRICARRGVACHDLAADLPHDEIHFYDFCHFTEAGAARVAERVAAAAEPALWPRARGD